MEQANKRFKSIRKGQSFFSIKPFKVTPYLFNIYTYFSCPHTTPPRGHPN